MTIALTIINATGQTLCEKERYTFEELRVHPGFTNDERRCFIDLAPWLNVEWKRGGSTFRLERVRSGRRAA